MPRWAWGRSPRICVSVQGVRLTALVDSGACHTLLRAEAYEKLHRKRKMRPCEQEKQYGSLSTYDSAGDNCGTVVWTYSGPGSEKACRWSYSLRRGSCPLTERNMGHFHCSDRIAKLWGNLGCSLIVCGTDDLHPKKKQDTEKIWTHYTQ